MTSAPHSDYPPGAYGPTGEPWWKLKQNPEHPNRPFGDEQKISAWLAYAVGQGGTFTMRDLRIALGAEDTPNSAEHLNRRLRNLRTRDGWRIPSAKDDGSLAHDEYRVDVIGWHPGLGTERPQSNVVSNKVRRLVFERDKHTCAVCGTRAGEPYDDLPDVRARLTLGHRIPGRRLTNTATVDELQAECARCNETVRDEIFDPVTLPELQPRVGGLSKPEKKELLSWLEAGRRTKSRLEGIYADVMRLGQGEREELVANLQIMTQGRWNGSE